MPVEWNAALVENLPNAGAAGLLRAAIYLQRQHIVALNVSNPRPHNTPSKRGEYPRKRTGWGQRHVFYQPTSVAEIAKLGRVRIGYSENAFYMLILWHKRGRKGLPDTVRRFIRQLRALAGSSGAKS